MEGETLQWRDIPTNGLVVKYLKNEEGFLFILVNLVNGIFNNYLHPKITLIELGNSEIE